MLIEIYSDIVCPWCYVGELRFRRALADLPDSAEVEVVFRPFQLDPREPRGPRPLRERLAAKFGAQADAMMRRVGDAARQEGVEIRWDRGLAANTFDAHRLLALALDEGGPAVQRALAERLFAAHFVEGGDVGDHAQLAGHAAHVGLDRDRAAAFLASDEGVDTVRAAVDEARAIGVSAVPTFVLDGRYAVSGAQPVEVFRRVLDQVLAGTVER